MPYSVKTKDGITVNNIPDVFASDGPEVRKRVAEERAKRDGTAGPSQIARDAAHARTRAQDQVTYDPTADTSWGERMALNFGAGVDTLVQGTKQVAKDWAGIGPGVTDEEIEEKRRIDAQLGARDPVTGTVSKITGQVAPTIAGAALLAAGGVEAAGAAGVRAIPAAWEAAHPLIKTMLAGFTGGLGSGAIEPVKSDESRGENMETAAAAGLILPGVTSAAAEPVHQGWKVLSRAGATQKAREAIREMLPPGYRPNLEGVDDYVNINQPTTSGYGSREFRIPQTAAQATNDPHLAQLEAWSRPRPSTQPGWSQFDSDQNAARYRVTQDMPPSEQRLSRMEAVREGRTTPQREGALEAARQSPDFAAPVAARIDELVAGEAGADPAMQRIAAYVRGELDNENLSPERLYRVRKVLQAKLGRTGPTDTLGADAKAAQRETISILDAIDDALDDASGGQWRPYMREYAERSGPIGSGRALREVAETMEQKPYKGTSPEVTFAGYKGAVKQGVEGKWGTRLTPGDDEAVTVLRNTLRAQESAGRTRKITGTMGGGSNTNMDQQLASLGSRLLDLITQTKVGGMAAEGAQRITRFNQDEVEQQVMAMLQRPTRLAAELARLDPTHRQQLIHDALRAAQASGGAGAGAAAAGQ